MNGKANGVQSIFYRQVSQTHCYNHRLTLAIIDICKNIPEVEIFFTLGTSKNL